MDFSSKDEIQCESCHWYLDLDIDEGLCFYEPPKAFAFYNPDTQEVEERTVRPCTSPDSFCSKYTPIPDVTPTPTP